MPKSGGYERGPGEVTPGGVATYIADYADDLAVLARRWGMTRVAEALDEAQRRALAVAQSPDGKAAPEDAA